MDNVRYMCFCRSIFPTLNAFDSHVSCCEQLKTSSNVNVKPKSVIVRTIPEIESEGNVEGRSDFRIKIMKSWTIVMDDEQEPRKPDKMATNLWGRRLPRRTKVPYLSRAVPLSTDHSYERCQCGAVFVTRMGKRQHQARFCKFVKNKGKKSPTSDSLEEVTQKNVADQLAGSKSSITKEKYVVTTKYGDPEDLFENEHSLIKLQKLL